MEKVKDFGKDEKEAQRRLLGVVTTRELIKIISTKEDFLDQCIGLIKLHVLEDYLRPKVLNYFIKCIVFFEDNQLSVKFNRERVTDSKIDNAVSTITEAIDNTKKKIKTDQQELVRLYKTYIDIISTNPERELIKFSLQTNKRNESFQLDYTKKFILNALKDAFNKKGYGFETLVEASDKDGNRTSDNKQKVYNITTCLERYLNSNGFPLKEVKAPQFIKELYQSTGVIEESVSNKAAYKRIAYYIESAQQKS